MLSALLLLLAVVGVESFLGPRLAPARSLKAILSGDKGKGSKEKKKARTTQTLSWLAIPAIEMVETHLRAFR